MMQVVVRKNEEEAVCMWHGPCLRRESLCFGE